MEILDRTINLAKEFINKLCNNSILKMDYLLKKVPIIKIRLEINFWNSVLAQLFAYIRHLRLSKLTNYMIRKILQALE